MKKRTKITCIVYGLVSLFAVITSIVARSQQDQDATWIALIAGGAVICWAALLLRQAWAWAALILIHGFALEMSFVGPKGIMPFFRRSCCDFSVVNYLPAIIVTFCEVGLPIVMLLADSPSAWGKSESPDAG